MVLTLRFLSIGVHKRQLKWAAKGEECGKSKGVGGQKEDCQGIQPAADMIAVLALVISTAR